MHNWKQKLASFFYGRYGSDALGWALFVLYILLELVWMFTRMWGIALASSAVMLFMLFRMFSRNYSRRLRENERFLKLWCPIAAWLKLQFHRIRDARTSVYRKCPHCAVVLKLPRRRGRHTVRCPKCADRFETRVLF